ncbi:MAG: rod shape-determining protein RodA [Alistipes sp.]|nr:rod shape-determining protein RodA [Alistipes sp.]
MISEYNISSRQRSNSLFGRVDKVALLSYISIVILGLVFITSASYDHDTESIFAFSHNYMKQAIWICFAWVIATVVLLLDRRIFHMFATPAYVVGVLLLIAALLFGREVNGAKAWFEFGSIRVQPVEFVKIAVALMMARVMSDYSFNINRPVDLVKVAAVIMIPFSIIVLQNDTGSGLVLGAFIFVLFREGLSKYIYFPVLFTIFLFVVSLIFEPVVIFTVLIVLFTLYSLLHHGAFEGHVVFLCAIFLVALLLALLTPLSGYAALMIASAIAVIALLFLVVKTHTMSLLWPIIMFIYAMVFVPTCDLLFSKLEPHQQNRIHTFVGLVDDPQGVGYNVMQSEIAIGSGGLLGKGLLQGTQNRYDFVPEKHTDFIFSVVGEEWGFVGALIVVSLYMTLILRLMRMGERIKEPFGRVYCYAVAAMLLLHVCVNIGMTIGLMPVMGIPLPLMSYGGSSLVAFTLLIMIAIRLDASTVENDGYRGI